MDQSILDLVNGMSEEQGVAASVLADPVLIIAGAGSGKTRTLVGRLAKLLLPVHLGGYGQSPDSVVMVTFTNKAARETVARIEPLMQALRDAGHVRAGDKVWAGTFHSLSLRILRLEAARAGFSKNFSIYDDSDSESLIKEITAGDDRHDMDSFLRNLELAKASLLSPEFLEKAAAGNELRDRYQTLADPSFLKHYKTYQTMLQEQSAVDFADLLNHVTNLFRDDEEVRGRWQARFRHFMIDEVQDVNRAQIQWLAALTNGARPNVPGDAAYEDHFNGGRVAAWPKPSVAFVGDDDQSIYGFRGSDSSVLRGLRGRFPGVTVRALQTSYRCQPAILDVSHALVSRNSQRLDKRMVAHPSTGESRKLTIEQVKDVDAEARGIIARVRAGIAAGENYSDHAILVRSRKLAQRFTKSLRQANVPVQEGATSDAMKSAEFKDTLAFAGYLVNPDSELYLRRIINKPARGLGPTSMMKVAANAKGNQRSLSQELNAIAQGHISIPEGGETYGKAFVDSVRHFMALCYELRNKLGLSTTLGRNPDGSMSRLADPLSQSVIGEDGLVADAGQALTLILSSTGYIGDLRDKVIKATGMAPPNGPEQLSPAGFIRLVNGDKDGEKEVDDFGGGTGGRATESMRRLSNLATIIERASAFGGLEAFIQEVSLDQENGEREEPNAVRVMTLHGSKGLEFDHVHLPCFIEGIIPSARSMEDDSGAGVEEERRVAYVGLTRGAKTVHLSSSFSPIPEANLRRPGPPSRFINEIRSTCPDLVEFSAARQQGGYRPMFNSGYGRQRPAVQERPAGSAAASSRPTVASPEAARPRPVQAAGGQLVRRSRPDEGLTP
jgi:DNA helicase-2/ATP-dependent DNA helicase PcrA